MTDRPVIARTHRVRYTDALGGTHVEDFPAGREGRAAAEQRYLDLGASRHLYPAASLSEITELTWRKRGDQ